MKKITSVLLSMLLLWVTALPSWAYQFSYQFLNRGDNQEPLVPKIEEAARFDTYLTTVNGKEYIIQDASHYSPLEKGQEISSFMCYLPSGKPYYLYPYYNEYLWTGQYYMVRDTGYDGVWPDWERAGAMAFPLLFYDGDFNLVHEQYFPRNSGINIVSAIGYYNGTYYCALHRNWNPVTKQEDIIMKSTDMVNWTETEEPLPRQLEDVTFMGDNVALGHTGPLTNVQYENQQQNKFQGKLGEWALKTDEDFNFYLTNDNIYFVKIDSPVCPHIHDQELYEEQYGSLEGYIAFDQCEYPEQLHKSRLQRDKYEYKGIYEYEDDIVIDIRIYHMGELLRLTVPKADIYAELEAQKDAPYVQLNGSILGFEETPVIEDDRILVPMRFLFEQMGAEVEWDNDTQTATVLQESDEIAFQINNLSANVNSQPQTMDVPARLINDKTMIPLRFLSEHLGYTVEWDGTNNMAIVTQESPQ